MIALIASESLFGQLRINRTRPDADAVQTMTAKCEPHVAEEPEWPLLAAPSTTTPPANNSAKSLQDGVIALTNILDLVAFGFECSDQIIKHSLRLALFLSNIDTPLYNSVFSHTRHLTGFRKMWSKHNCIYFVSIYLNMRILNNRWYTTYGMPHSNMHHRSHSNGTLPIKLGWERLVFSVFVLTAEVT